MTTWKKSWTNTNTNTKTCGLAVLGLVLSMLSTLSTHCFAKGDQAAIIETAPLRGMMGHPALRGELVATRQIAVGAAFEATDAPSERQDFKDRTRAINLDAFWYPLGAPSAKEKTWQGAPFLGGGLAWEEAAIGRERRRDAVTWARTEPGETHDRWVNHESYLTATQTLGYRVASSRLLTASLRLTRSEVLMSQSRVERDSVYSREPDLSGEHRKAVTAHIVLHAGLLLE